MIPNYQSEMDVHLSGKKNQMKKKTKQNKISSIKVRLPATIGAAISYYQDS